jgi:hypothetical protein
MHAALPLRTAVRNALIADAPLLALLGGPRVHDEVPAATTFPFVALGDGEVRDWSTQDSAGEEHRLTLAAWSRQGGRREASLIAAAILQCLAGASLTLPGHTLVSLRFAEGAVTREGDGRTYAARIRLRALTERL